MTFKMPQPETSSTIPERIRSSGIGHGRQCEGIMPWEVDVVPVKVRVSGLIAKDPVAPLT